MLNIDNLCMGCMKDIGSAVQCPYCGHHRGNVQMGPFLPIGTVIDGRYIIGKKLDSNGDGVSYLAWQTDRETPVLIREYLPDTLISRVTGTAEIKILKGCELIYSSCRDSFTELWRKLARLRDIAAVLPVFNIIETNNTVYAIADKLEGVTLRDYLLRSETGCLTWEKARQLFMPLLTTLETLHGSGIIHRGISPSALMVGMDGKLRLYGFSILEARSVMGELTPELFDGFAALEQYSSEDMPQGTWTDIYAFAAVLYRVLAGTIPMSSPDRRNNDRLMIPARVAEKLPAYVIDALINALQIMPVDRTRTAEQLRAELSASPSFVENYQDRNTAVVNAPPKKQAEDNIYDARDDREYDDEDDNGKRSSGGGGKKLILGIILGIFLAFAGLGVFMFYTQNGGIINPTPTTAPHITTAAAETTANDAFPVVPLFIGRNDQDVKNDAVLMGKFDIEFKEQSSVEFPKGIIIEQDIAPNDIVSKGTKIILTVSSGLPKVIVPPLAGHDYNEAAEALTALGLYCIPAEKVNDGSNIGGAIIDTIPAEGTVLEQGADIFINFWEYINGEPKPTAAPKAPVEE